MNANPAPQDPKAAPESAHRYDVYVVENYEGSDGGEKSHWTKVGVAFPHKDDKGFNVELKAVPVGGKLVIRRHEVNFREHET